MGVICKQKREMQIKNRYKNNILRIIYANVHFLRAQHWARAHD